jgi:hypothetical protein
VDAPVSRVASEYLETSASPRVAAVPLAHLSIELGHLYADDLAAGPERLKELFRQVAPWAQLARESCQLAVRPKRARVSTCFLVDDYFGELGPPYDVVPQILAAAADAGLEIDYLARESGCAVADGVDLARLVEGRLVADPPPNTTGSRPPPTVSGWLCNGQRSPQASGEAMRESAGWRPPSENGANRHSIFVDVQLWDEPGGGRRWSCAYLAGVWQLLRLGLLRYEGRPVAGPRPAGQPVPQTWEALPTVARLNDVAAPFTAYRTFSVLPGRFLPVEVAVRTMLSQYAVEEAVAKQVSERAEGEGLALPLSVIDRIEYAFAGGAWR